MKYNIHDRVLSDIEEFAKANNIEKVILFGSRARGTNSEKSDIDLCVETSLKGFDFIGLSEDIRNLLHKKIDLIRFDTLENNFDLINEIMKDGIKIYG